MAAEKTVTPPPKPTKVDPLYITAKHSEVFEINAADVIKARDDGLFISAPGLVRKTIDPTGKVSFETLAVKKTT